LSKNATLSYGAWLVVWAQKQNRDKVRAPINLVVSLSTAESSYEVVASWRCTVDKTQRH